MLELVKLSASFPDLPAAFDGYRILHLTDLHLDNIEDTAAVAAERIADIEHDLCVITGDIRDNIHAPLAPLIRRLETIVAASKASDGIVAVLGNHDSASMVAPMEALGIRVLLNERMTLVRAMDVLHVTGLDDVHRFHTEAADAALAAAPDAFCIALVHSPEVAGLAVARHRVYLTGHTHGGQICWPGGRALTNSLKQHRDFDRGLWRYGDMVGYTNRGVGSCVVPFRSYCPGEVMVMTLHRGPEQVSLGSTFGTI
jgi:predicted MPP superfamily phosphohydrolase